MELANENIRTLAMDYHGLVAATCKDLEIAEKINSKIINNDDRRIVTTGKALVAIFVSNYGDVAQRWLLVYSDQALHKINSAIVPIMKHAKRGKPKSGQEKSVVGYKIESSFERDADAINLLLNSKGRFILATNDMDSKNYTDQQMLEEYKDQQKRNWCCVIL